MSSEWPVYTVQQLVDNEVLAKPKDGNHGSIHPKSSDYVDFGVPFIMATDMLENGVDFKNCKYITEEMAASLRKGFAEPGDVLLSHKATIGRTSILQVHPYSMVVLTPQVTYYRVIDEEILDNKYLHYYFKSESFQNLFNSWAGGGSTRAYLGITDQRKLPITVPPIGVQRDIARILGDLDQKIHLNQQTNETLEVMAQAIFKSWFVDFDPVRAKIEAKSADHDANRAAMAAIAGIPLEQGWDEIEAALDQKLARMSETQQQQLSRTAVLFPDELVESEIEEVPKGWVYSTIGKEFDIVNGQSPPGSSYNEEGEGAPFYQGRTDFGFRFPTKRVYCTEPKRFAKKGDTLLSVRAPVGDLNIAIEDCCIGRGLASLRHNLGSTSYTYYAMKQVQVQIETYEATGTVFGSINQKQLKALDTISPDDQIINEFHRIVEPIDSKIMNQVFMNRELSELRDILLPKLISGEVGV